MDISRLLDTVKQEAAGGASQAPQKDAELESLAKLISKTNVDEDTLDRSKDEQASAPATSAARLTAPQAPSALSRTTPPKLSGSPPPARTAEQDLRTESPQPLSRAQLQEPALIMAMGRYLARQHSQVTESMPKGADERALFVFTDARMRLGHVQGDQQKREASPIDLNKVAATLDALEPDLLSESRQRVFGDFNHYPGSLSMTADGDIVSNPDERITGWHSPFEVLNRHVFTSRLDHEDMQILADAYTQRTLGRQTSPAEMINYGKAKYVFDLMYCLYFVDIAFDTPSAGTEKGIHRDKALAEADELLERIDADWFWLTQRGVDLEPVTLNPPNVRGPGSRQQLA